MKVVVFMSEKEKIALLSYFINRESQLEKEFYNIYSHCENFPTSENIYRLTAAFYALHNFMLYCKDVHKLLKL